MKYIWENYRNLFLFTIFFILITGIPLYIYAPNMIWVTGFMLVMDILCLMITFHDQRNRDQNPTIVKLIFWIMPVIALFTTLTQVLVFADISINLIMIIMYVMVGLLFIVIGNYLPKTKQNHFMGIRVRWTLENEANWYATHRFAGKLWVLSGLLCILCAALPEEAGLCIFFVILMIACFGSVLYSYLYYRKQLQNHSVEKIQGKSRNMILTVIILVVTCVFVIVIMVVGKLEIQTNSDTILIETNCWSDMEISCEEITDVVYLESVDGTRVNGFANSKLALGTFKSETYGSYTRYTHNSCDSVIAIYLKDSLIVINGESEQDTLEIYDTLTKQIAE